MKYMSDDGKNVFNTEQECCEYERMKRIKQDRLKKIEEERIRRLEEINKRYEELQNMISEYEKDYMVKEIPYFAPVYELMNMLR